MSQSHPVNTSLHSRCLRTRSDVYTPPQRSNAMRVRNMNRFNGGKLPGNSKHFYKTSKDEAVPGKRSIKRWYL